MQKELREPAARPGCFPIEEPIDQEYVDACDGVIIGTPTWVAKYLLAD